MNRDVSFQEFSQELLHQLPKGAFLTVKNDDKVNVMTIGWGSVGFIWGKPVFTVLVRYSRYTYELLEKAGEFTVSVPIKKDLKQELMVCGTKSGRDIDKFKECRLTPEKGQVVSTPVIKECDLHMECKVVYKQAMDETLIDHQIQNAHYPKGDYHVLYYGEIVAGYVTE